MSHRRILAALAATLVALLVSGPAVSAGRGRAREGRPSLPPLVTGVRGGGLGDGLRDIMVGRDGPGRTGDAVRDAVRAAAGLPAMEEEDEMAGSGILLAAGDLDGDGADDVIEDQWGYAIVALRGSTGAPLWSRSFDEGFGTAIPAGDLDGAGGDDLLMLDIVEETLAPDLYAWRITYAGVRGSDGHVLWSHTYDNQWGFSYSNVHDAYVDINFAIPLDVGDADGDGVLDILVGRYHIVAAYEYASGRYLGASVAGVVFEVRSGGTGEVLSTLQRTTVRGFSDAVLVPDLSGDDAEDVVVGSYEWDEEYESMSGSIAAVGGADGLERWRVPVSGTDAPYLSGFVLAGDTVGDVVLETFDWSEEETSMRALSGVGGAALWGATVPGWSFTSAAGEGDLLVTSDVYDDDEDVYRAYAARLDGEDGATAWSLSTQEAAAAIAVGDVTGDAIADVAVTPYTIDWEEWEVVLTGASTLVSGADGAAAWTTGQRRGWLVGVAGDLNADGTDDLAQLVPVGARDRVHALAGSGAELWPQGAVSEGRIWWLESAPLEGAGADLLETGYRATSNSYAEFTAARSGETGAGFWARVSEY